MATLQNLSDALDNQSAVIAQEAQEVQTALDGLNEAIAELRAQADAALQPIIDKVEANTQAIQNVFTPGPTPTPQPSP